LVEVVITREPELHKTELDPGDPENILADLLLGACAVMLPLEA
jgi:hypothetical protein